MPNPNIFDIIHVYTNSKYDFIHLHNEYFFTRAEIDKTKNLSRCEMFKIKFINTLLVLIAVTMLITLAAPHVSAENGDIEAIMNEVVFFGDSTTAHLAVRGGIPKERVWSGYGSTLLYTSVLERSVCIDGEMMSIFEAAKKFSPKILVITIGASGGAGFLKERDFKQIYKKLLVGVKMSSPSTKIIVQSILPLSDKSVKYYKKLTKQSVATANVWIKEVCDELHVPYLNTHDLLIDKSGYLKAGFQNDEYLHLTSAAYNIILNNLKNYIFNNIDTFK